MSFSIILLIAIPSCFLVQDGSFVRRNYHITHTDWATVQLQLTQYIALYLTSFVLLTLWMSSSVDYTLPGQVDMLHCLIPDIYLIYFLVFINPFPTGTGLFLY